MLLKVLARIDFKPCFKLPPELFFTSVGGADSMVTASVPLVAPAVLPTGAAADAGSPSSYATLSSEFSLRFFSMTLRKSSGVF